MRSARTLGAIMLVAIGGAIIHGAEPIPQVCTLAVLDIPKDGCPIFVPVRVGGRRLKFVVDTGASRLALDNSLRSEAGPYLSTMRLETAGNDAIAKVFESPSIFLGEMDVGRGTSTVFWDLSELRQVCGYEMSGIIGMPSLENCIVQIDFDKGRLTLLKRIKPHEDWGESVPIIPDRYGIPRVFISVPGEEFPFVVDTGSYTTCITAEVLRSLRRKNAIVAVGDNRHRTLTGDRTTTTYKLSNLSLARFEHKDLLVDEGRQCRIGLQYLSRFCVTFDFPDGQMYLKKGSRYESRDQPDLCGLSLHPNQPRLVVEFVSPDSAAEHAGIQAGDEIIRIDGKESSAFSRFEIRQLFRSEEGRTIRVEISRSGETVCSELTLKPTPFTDTREPGR